MYVYVVGCKVYIKAHVQVNIPPSPLKQSSSMNPGVLSLHTACYDVTKCRYSNSAN